MALAPDKIMLFSSPEFILAFLPIVLAGYVFVAKFSNQTPLFGWLVLSSLFFYAYWSPPYIALLLFSILINYLTGNSLIRAKSKRLLIAGVAFNLGLIGVFKYFDFFIGSINIIFSAALPSPSIILPLAISFFTFQQIAYLVDVYKGEVKDTGLLHYILFVSFFPQLIAGPIVHHKEIIPQFNSRKKRRFEGSDFFAGAAIFIIGLQKKIVIADGIGVHADALFSNLASQDPTFIQSWIGTLAYTFQIYFDFSGYSDMAIGLARMFGIRLPENFNSPYKATNIIDFWRRWHMTLSRFLKEYLYIPLGGNRKGSGYRHINVLITMVLGGLWHGAAWTFVFWGFLHGIFLIVNHLWRAGREAMGQDLNRSSFLGRIASRSVTLLAVIVAWVFFRAESWSDAFAVLHGMAGLNGILIPISWAPYFGGAIAALSELGVRFVETPPYQVETLFNLAGLGIIVLLLANTRELMVTSGPLSSFFRTRLNLPMTPAIVVFGFIGLLVVLVRGAQTSDFIYMVF
jgi:alginate O-acetyltransferase complex protein AlgI